MVVELRTLRITSDFDAGRYVAGMNQKSEADRAGAQTSKAVGAAIDDVKIKVSSAVPLIERLSRTYIDGYGTAAKFNTEIMRLARSQDTHAASVEHLEQIYTGLHRKFGLVADATDLAARGYTGLASAIQNVNSRLTQTDTGQAATALAARIEQLRTQFDPAYVAAQRLSSELNDLAEAERLGVQITGGYERALEALTLKHDAAAAAAKRQRDEYARLAQEGREALAADRSQAEINAALRVGAGTGLRASESAAVFSEQLGRQEEIARLRAQQEAANFASDLNQRFAFNGRGLSAQASASVFSEALSRQDELDRLRAQQQGASFTSDLNQRLGVNGFGTSARASAGAFEEAARAAEELDRKVAAVRAQIDPLGAAQNRLNAELAEYEVLASRGAISSDELAKAQLVARQRYDAYSSEMQRTQKKGVGRLAGYDLTNLMYQGTDVVQSLALGMPIQQVFLQQGPQIAQIFAANSAGAKGFIASLGGTTVALTGTVATLALGGKALNDYLVSIKSVETAAAGLGRAMAGTAAQMENAAVAGADAAGISVKSARVMESQFLRTGKIGAEHFEGLIAVSKDFATTFGTDVSEAGVKLSEMFADPAKAAQQLSRQYGLIDSATAEYVQRLTAQNRASEAQSVLLAALPQRLASAAEATTAFGRAWNFVATSASDAWDAIGRGIDSLGSDPSLEEKIAAARVEYERFSKQSQSWVLRNFNGAQDRSDSARTRLDDLMEQQRRNEQRAAEQARAARLAELINPAIDIAGSVSSTAEARQRRALEDQVAALDRGRSAALATESRVSADSFADISTAYDAVKRALDTYIPSQEKAQQLAQLDMKIAAARDPLTRANLAAERERIQLAGESITTAEAENRIALARNQIMQEAIASASAQNADMRDEIEARRQLSTLVASGSITQADANRLLQEEAALRPLIAAAAIAEGAEKKRLQEVIADLRQSYAALADQQKEATAVGIVRGQSERLEDLRAEVMLAGETEQVRRRSLALLEAEQQIRREGLSGTSRASEIRSNAIAIAEQTAEVERLRDAWGEVQSAIEGVISSGVDKLIEGDWSGAIEDVAKEITGSLATLGIKNPLTNAVDGGNRGTLSDVGGLGGIWNRLFGGASGVPASIVGQTLGQSVGTLNVRAANVVVNGGLTGGLSNLLSGAANDNTASGYPGLAAYASAIKSIESAGSGGYSALGPITASGDRAYGAYQIMGSNIGPWSKAALGKSVSIDEFMRDPSMQDQIFNHRFGGYVSKYGVSGAAQAWFGGPGSVGGSGKTTDILGTSGKEYVTKFNSSLERLSGSANGATGAVGNLGSGLDAASNSLNQFDSGLGKFGQSLQSALSGGNSGLAGLLGSFTSYGINAFNASPQFASAVFSGKGGLWSTGGYTGPGGVHEPAGVVHRGEVVWSQRDVARAGGPAVVDAMRLGLTGYAGGGAVDWQPPVYAPAAVNGNSAKAASGYSGPLVEVHNYSSAQVERKETTDSRGARREQLVLYDAVSDAVSNRGSPVGKTMERNYGVRRQGIARS